MINKKSVLIKKLKLNLFIIIKNSENNYLKTKRNILFKY
jgi:hypothetical protein